MFMRTNLEYAQRDAKEWHEAKSFFHHSNCQHQQSSHSVPANRNHVHRWTTPPVGFIKCNYDGSYVRDLTFKGGWILRSDFGRFLGAGQAVGKVTNNPLESEFQALTMAMQSCWSKGYKKVYFEGDNKEVVAIINGKQSNFAAFNWMRDIRYWKNKFDECYFVWTNRQCNKAADILAKAYLPRDSYSHFHSCISSVIANTLLDDSVL
ncbi:hypothetical protein ARALYDRAFT_917421 [Arabidopsis lyrata subsp. lyrata]|uniref:RNase H type-1 domain-containing protein n=1 Tax=Arabidopsis lyrata subsp. lyrata TaxID=81972 RepID=D7MQS6_ARALL|nr:hypothetical protein ARALYDRAFT_917421 [Arabidopsis lyrata subsp. lyrata]